VQSIHEDHQHLKEKGTSIEQTKFVKLYKIQGFAKVCQNHHLDINCYVLFFHGIFEYAFTLMFIKGLQS
jgi:hypothetical protein